MLAFYANEKERRRGNGKKQTLTIYARSFE